METQRCPIYSCCICDSRLSHCGECAKLPCKLYYDTQDPSVSREEHEAQIRERVNNLRSMLKKAE